MQRLPGLMRRAPRAGFRQGQFGLFLGTDDSEEWYTPPSVFEALGETFDLDPCHPVGEPLPWVPARKRFTKIEDGLAQPWIGFVWLNPPYGKAVEAWMERLVAHPGGGIALVYARTDTYWFLNTVRAASGLCFATGRVRFVNREGVEAASGRPGSASVLLAFGDRARKALERSGLGWLASPDRPDLTR